MRSPQLNNLSQGHTELVNNKLICGENSSICKALTLSIYQAPDPRQRLARWKNRGSANQGPGPRTVAKTPGFFLQQGQSAECFGQLLTSLPGWAHLMHFHPGVCASGSKAGRLINKCHWLDNLLKTDPTDLQLCLHMQKPGLFCI